MTIKAGTILILDDDASVRKAYSRSLTDEGYRVCDFSSFEELKTFCSSGEAFSGPTCLLLDMKMPDVSGLVVQKWLKDHHLSLSVIFISGQSEIGEAIVAMRSGAIDFLLKPISEDQLVAAVDGVLYSQRVASTGEGLPPGFERLTAREVQVLSLVVQGLRSQQIADQLGITLRTVKMHRGNIMAKASVENVAQLVSLYQESRFAGRRQVG